MGTSLPALGLVSLVGQRKCNSVFVCSAASLLSWLCSAPLPEMLPDDIGPAALWEALGSDPAALRAVHTADTRTHAWSSHRNSCLCLKMSGHTGSWEE